MVRMRRFVPAMRMAAEMIDEDEMEKQEEENKRADAVAKSMKLSKAQKRALYPEGEQKPAQRVPHNANLYMDIEDFNELEKQGLVLPKPKQ